ncbi:MAG: prepilin-type N-terminal cleavage/methylation domain-containing protein [Gemmatimonadetes bacterium]|nr:prepilin-type N-terminal cleavage/methylation domain-containing protein [Gemmatimonadota bacterium]
MNRRRRGMTLLEVVIALTILALLAGGGAAAFVTLIERQETIRTASNEVERAAALRETVRQWILQGEPLISTGGVPGGRGGAGAAAAGGGRQLASVAPGGRAAAATVQGVTAAASTGQEVTVLTNAPNPLLANNVRIRIFVDADDATPERGLTIEYQATTQTPLMRRELEPAVGDLLVEYYDSRTNRWYPSTEAATIDPIALRLTMVSAEGATLARLLRVPILLVFGEAES